MIFENQEVKGTLYEDSDFLFWLMVYILQSKKFYFTFFAKSLLKKQTYDIVTRKLVYHKFIIFQLSRSTFYKYSIIISSS